MLHDDQLHFGACWCPERWPQERWDEDLRLMAEAGLGCVRWGEAAWSAIEPTAGTYDWTLPDRLLERCTAHGLGVILTVPTAAAPAWFDATYPDAVRRRHQVERNRGGWRIYDYANPDYRRACRALIEALAERYVGDERVWAWQIDDAAAAAAGALVGPCSARAFRFWLVERYGSIEALNRAWGYAGSSERIADFDHIAAPDPSSPPVNPHRHADVLQFCSDAARGFIDEQRDCLRARDREAVVIVGGRGLRVDRQTLIEDCATYGHAHFPRLAGEAAERPVAGLDVGAVRHYAERLWITELQAGQVGNTVHRHPTSPPGELSVVALQALGHGGNLLAWSPWRSPSTGAEINSGGLLSHWGEAARHYRECRELIGALRPHAAVVAASRPAVAVARLLSYRQELGARVEPWIEEAMGPVGAIGRRALLELGLNENRLRPGDLRPGDGYAVALMPLAIAVDEEEVAALEAWVRAGGVLVVGPMAGYRDAGLQAPGDRPPPGPLAALTGTTNPEGTTSDRPVTILAADGGQQIRGSTYAEIIEPAADDVALLARHSTDWLATRGAVVERSFGEGRVVHCGVALTDEVLEWLWVDRHLPRPKPTVLTHEQSAETLTRLGDGYAIHFTLNHGPGPAVFYLYRAVQDLLTGEAVSNSYTLTGYHYRILIERFGAE